MKTIVALVGTRWRGDDIIALFKSLPQGEPLTLIRDRNNQMDPYAVQVWARDRCVGFIKSTQVRPIATRLDKMATARPGGGFDYVNITAKLAIDGGRQPMVEIEE